MYSLNLHADRAGTRNTQSGVRRHRDQVLRALPRHREGDDRHGRKGVGLWDEKDGFYYDELTLPDGRVEPLKVRSMVGLIPLFAVEVLEPELLAKMPAFAARLRGCLDNRADLAGLVSRWFEPGRGERRLLVAPAR